MIVGFNHNITYRGTGFHVQTEDSGIKNPQLVTLLYHNGTIISSQKTVYADIIKVDKLDLVIEDLAKEQHKGMLRRLTAGEFDERIAALGISLGPLQDKKQTAPTPPVEAPVAREEIVSPPVPDPEPVRIVEEPIVDKFQKPKKNAELSLDDLVYAYLTAGQDQR